MGGERGTGPIITSEVPHFKRYSIIWLSALGTKTTRSQTVITLTAFTRIINEVRGGPQFALVEIVFFLTTLQPSVDD